MLKPQVDGLPADGGSIQAVVHTGRFDTTTCHTGFMHIQFCAVETTEVIDDTHHELQRVIGLEEETLITLYRIRGRMPLAKL